MQWWAALSQQFTQIATQAMKDGATDAAKNLAGAMVKQGIDAAGETLKKAAGVPMAVAKTAAAVASQTVGAVGTGKAASSRPARKASPRKTADAAATPARRRASSKP